MKQQIEFDFNCPCLQTFRVKCAKPKMIGCTIVVANCNHCESEFHLKVRFSKTGKKKTDFEARVLKSIASEKLVRTMQLRSAMKFRSPSKWKEEIERFTKT